MEITNSKKLPTGRMGKTDGPRLDHRAGVEQLIERNQGKRDFKRIIRDMGLKVTGQRLAILQELGRGRAHVTAQEVFENVHTTHSEIGFATVYRFLRDLTNRGIVTEVRMGGLPARYELTPDRHHDHLTCTVCGKIVEFENHQVEQLQIDIASEHGFVLTGHVLELYGHCQDQKKCLASKR